ncbi:MAG: hypothetical protein CMK59_11305 [Proteobacteria bacterium]|nr:hypothetical protein [Pseudomonadota bacterium]
MGNENSLWRSSFLPPAKQAEMLAKRALKDLRRESRHRYWNVEALDFAVRTNGVEQVLTELRQSEAEQDLIEALEEELENLSGWDFVAQPQRFLSLWRDRSFQEGWTDQRRQAEGILFDCGWASLQQQQELPNARSLETGFDPSRIGLVATSNQEFLMDVEKTQVVIWDVRDGSKNKIWKTEIDIVDCTSFFDERMLIALSDGSLWLWNLEEEEPKHWLTPSVLLSKMECSENHILGWTETGVAVMNQEGALIRLHALDLDVPPVICFSGDGQRILCADEAAIWVWSVDGNEQYHISEDGELDADEIIIATSILDMGSTSLGLKAMDRIELWGASLKEQYDLLQSMPEPLALSPTGNRLVSCEAGKLSLWEMLDVDESKTYRQMAEVSVPDMWGDAMITPLSEDCRYITAVLPDGIAAWDLIKGKVAALPIPFSFATSLTAIPQTRMVAVDNGQRVRIYRYVGG